MTHLSAAGFTRSRDAIAGFIKNDMTPADVVGVVVGDKMVGNRIGSDKDALLKALAETKSPNLSRYVEMRAFPRIIDDVEAAKIAKNDERTITNATERACREQPGDCSGAGGDAGVRQQIESKGQRIAAETQRDTSLTLTALESLANGLARLPGPEAGCRFLRGLLHRRHERVAQERRGDRRQERRPLLDFRRPWHWEKRPFAKLPGCRARDVLGRFDVARHRRRCRRAHEPGARHGRRPVHNFNNFREPLEKLARETSTYYVIGYRPTRAFDGSYRTSR